MNIDIEIWRIDYIFNLIYNSSSFTNDHSECVFPVVVSVVVVFLLLLYVQGKQL